MICFLHQKFSSLLCSYKIMMLQLKAIKSICLSMVIPLLSSYNVQAIKNQQQQPTFIHYRNNHIISFFIGESHLLCVHWRPLRFTPQQSNPWVDHQNLLCKICSRLILWKQLVNRQLFHWHLHQSGQKNKHMIK